MGLFLKLHERLKQVHLGISSNQSYYIWRLPPVSNFQKKKNYEKFIEHYTIIIKYRIIIQLKYVRTYFYSGHPLIDENKSHHNS